MARPFKIRRVSPDDPASRAAVRILRRRLRELYSHWRDPEEMPTPQQLHDQRISGKRLRYSAETLRDFYPDRLALLVDMLKRQQDLLGLIQDCVTQRAIVATHLARRRSAGGKRDEIAALEALLAKYDERQSTLFADLRNIWRGMTRQRFRTALRDLVSHPNPEVER